MSIIVIGLLVFIFLAIVAPRFLGFVFGVAALAGVGAFLANGHSHPTLYVAIGILFVVYFIRGATSGGE